MSDTEPRKRMISLRLSDVEYEILKAHYRSCGARNVSDLARLALQRIVSGPTPSPDAVAAKLAELDGRIYALESLIAPLRQPKPQVTIAASEDPPLRQRAFASGQK
jgi:hypothetical protein